MGLEKAIQYGKEKRRDYYDSRSVDRSCRRKGGCSWCEGNRTRQQQRLNEAAEQERREAETVSRRPPLLH